MRRKWYPTFVKQGKLTMEQSYHQLQAQEAIVRTLMRLDAEQRQLPLFGGSHGEHKRGSFSDLSPWKGRWCGDTLSLEANPLLRRGATALASVHRHGASPRVLCSHWHRQHY